MPDLIPGMGNILPQVDVAGLSMGISTAMQYLGAFLVLAVFIVIAHKKKWLNKYPTKFYIYTVLGGKLSSVREDYGRRVIKRKDGAVTDFYYDIKNADFKWHPPSHEYMLGTSSRGRVAVHVREISHNNWEAFDPDKLVKAETLEYRSAERREMDDYFKNTQDRAGQVKYQLDKGQWQKVIDVLPAAIMLLIIGVVISMGMGPIGDFYNGILSHTDAAILEGLRASNENLNMSNRMFDSAMRFCGQSASCLANLGITVNASSGAGVIP